MRIPVELAKCWKLLNHGPVTLVACAAGGRRNVMAAQWVMPIDFDPPKLVAVIAGDTLTRRMLEESGECVVSAPVAAQADLVTAVGTVSGAVGDKFERFRIATAPASKVAAPLIEGCAAWLECRVLPEPHAQEAYDMFILEAVAAWADDAVWRKGRWVFPDDARRTIHHAAGGAYFRTGESFQAARP